MEKLQYRQGDVALVRVDQEIEGSAVTGKMILAHGEVTGHYHEAVGDGVALLEIPGTDLRYLSVERVAQIKHQEHHVHEVPAGVYEVRIQQEYAPGEIRRVLD